jgi:hypothetical protein
VRRGDCGAAAHSFETHAYARETGIMYGDNRADERAARRLRASQHCPKLRDTPVQARARTPAAAPAVGVGVWVRKNLDKKLRGVSISYAPTLAGGMYGENGTPGERSEILLSCFANRAQFWVFLRRWPICAIVAQASG